MAEEDGDTWYCFYAVMKLKWKPNEFAFLPPRERALMYAFIDEKIKQEEKQRKSLQNKNRKSSRRGGRR